MLSDLDFVGSVENDPATGRSSRRGSASSTKARCASPTSATSSSRRATAYPSAGFVILQGCRNPHGSVELKRIVLQPKGLGYGRACVRLLAQMAFRDLGAHRFWLDVKSANTRALALYRSEGFVEEGRLRESVRGGAGYDSLIVMSMLEPEHEALVEARASAGGDVARSP